MYVHTFLSSQRPCSCGKRSPGARRAAVLLPPQPGTVIVLQRRLDRIWALPRLTAGMANSEPYAKQALPLAGLAITCAGYMLICLLSYYPCLSLYLSLYIHISLFRSLSLYCSLSLSPSLSLSLTRFHVFPYLPLILSRLRDNAISLFSFSSSIPARNHILATAPSTC